VEDKERVKGLGCVKLSVLVTVQFRASRINNVYVPAHSPVKGGDPITAGPDEGCKVNEYGAVPPDGFELIIPSHWPLQEGETLLVLGVITKG
jgi:hypothetical protein